jgi:riboflavin kinase / FMN adenylyltransferase
MQTQPKRRARPFAVCRNGDAIPAELRGAVIAIGNFDGLHRGHQALIGTAVDLARRDGRPAALLTFDPHPRAFFAPDIRHFRLTPEPVKLKILDRLGLNAAFIRRFDAELAKTSARDFVLGLLADELGASALVIGGDFHFGRGREGTPGVLVDLAREKGIGVTVVGTVEAEGGVVSSSRIRTALEDGDVDLANALLGYRWFVRGEVRHGDKRGRTLGYPTANMKLDPGCHLAHGIYAVRAALADGKVVDGVASFGRRPTFDNGAPLLETYLFDHSSDLYGTMMEVEFVGRIRPEARFDSAEALVAQMRQDEEEARAVLSRAREDGTRSFIG